MVFLLSSSSVLAIGKPLNLPERPSTNRNVPNNPKEPAALQTQSRNGLNPGSLKSCLARESAVTNRFDKLTQLATNMEEKFDAIATRVEEYYTSKVLPTNKTVTNYDALVADIAASKQTIKTGLVLAKADVTGFSCTGEDPKGQIAKYNDDMKVVIQELKDFRTSINKLIVAVHSVTGETESNKPSVSPTK